MCGLGFNRVASCRRSRFETQSARLNFRSAKKPNAYGNRSADGFRLATRTSKVPPIVSDVSCVAVFFTDDLSTLPCTVMPKLKEPIQLYTDSGRLQDVPANSRLLRFSAASELTKGGVSEVQARVGDDAEKRKVLKGLRFKVAFGLPWTWKAFIKKAVESEHPFLKGTGVPWGLQQAIIECKFRLDRCKRWLVRARDLDHQEMQSNEGRPSHVAAVTKGKRLLLTREILEELQYDDMGASSLLDAGATLAGEVEQTDIFPAQFQLCLMTMEQLQKDAARRNDFILGLTKSSRDRSLDERLLAEIKEELDCGWAEGTFDPSSLGWGATISRRFALVQGSKTRMTLKLAQRCKLYFQKENFKKCSLL